MVNKATSQEPHRESPPINEAWWAALLAEEEKMWTPNVGDSASPEKIKHESRDVNWEHAHTIYEQDKVIDLQVTGYNRGGLLVEGEEFQGFVPLSHLVDMPGEKPDDDREPLLFEYIGRSLLLKVIECDPDRGRVVLSERAALAKPGSRTHLLESLKSGERVWGTVTNITDFGIFVDLGGLEGLIHVSELSWGRVRHPADSLNLGEGVEVFVISVDGERSRVALSLKRLFPNPWDTAGTRYYPGQIKEAVITSILPFGAFARLEEGLDGLIHVSEMDQTSETVKPADVLNEGQKVQVRVLQVDAAKQRLGLSLRLEE